MPAAVVALEGDPRCSPPLRKVASGVVDVGWWQGPVWLGRLAVAVVVSAWSLWQAPEWYLIAPAVTPVLVVLQIAPALLSRTRPVHAAWLALMAAFFAIGVLAWTNPTAGVSPSWPLDAYLVPLAPVLALAVARGFRWIAVLVPPLAGLVVFAPVADVMAGPLAGAVLTVAAGLALRRERRIATDERDRRIVLEERTRIARELHDVVGHHLSLIAVRTDSAPYRRTDLDGMREELVELGTAARQALAETRQLVEVLRDVHDLRSLTDPAGATLSVGPLPELSDTTRLALYRIVQESLTNVRKHSPGAPTAVTVAQRGRSIQVTVHNGPPGGRGLTGIRERAEALGGSSTAGPLTGGGYRVTAELPV